MWKTSSFLVESMPWWWHAFSKDHSSVNVCVARDELNEALDWELMISSQAQIKPLLFLHTSMGYLYLIKDVQHFTNQVRVYASAIECRVALGQIKIRAGILFFWYLIAKTKKMCLRQLEKGFWSVSCSCSKNCSKRSLFLSFFSKCVADIIRVSCMVKLVCGCTGAKDWWRKWSKS